MARDSWSQTLERLFLDVIGSLIPGLILLCPILAAGDGQHGIAGIVLPPLSGFAGAVILALAFVTGNALTSVGQHWIQPALAWISSAPGLQILSLRIRTKAGVDEQTRESGSYKAFNVLLKARAPAALSASKLELNELRNVAMTLISPEERQTTHRFKVLSNLNLGSAAAVILLACAVALSHGLSPTTDTDAPLSPALLWLLLLTPFLMERASRLAGMARSAPFSMAISELTVGDSTRGQETQPAQGLEGDGVYLAGGFKSGWQDTFTSTCQGVLFIDPREHGIEDPAAYTEWDLAGIDACAVVVANLEEANPGHYALSLEVGYARARGKPVYLVDGIGPDGDGRYMNMIRACSHVTFGTVEEAAEFLRDLPRCPAREGE